MNEFLSCFEANPKNLRTFADVMKYTAETTEEENSLRGMKTWEEAKSTADEYPVGSDKYRVSVDMRQAVAGQIGELLDQYNCDVISVPWWADTSAPISGCPQISVPLPAYPEGSEEERLVKGLMTTGPNIP